MTMADDREVLAVVNKSNEHSLLNNNTSVSIPEQSCTVTMLYCGPRVIKSNGSYKFKIHADEILILQSHTVTGAKSVFKGCIKPNDLFTFKSHRLFDRHFDIMIYINGIMDERIVVCCEKGFFNQAQFQTRRNSCQLQSITGGIPCETCLSYELMKLYAHDDPNHSRPSSTQSISQPDEQSPPTLISDSVMKSNKEQTRLLHNNTYTFNQNKDSNKTQTSINDQKSKNVDKEELHQQDNQSNNNIETSEGTSTQSKENDGTVPPKIMNEDIKDNISLAAKTAMDKLLRDYLEAFLSSTVINETTETDYVTESLISSNSKVAPDRAAKAKIHYTDSTSVLTTAASKAESFVLIWLDETIKENEDTVGSEQKLRAIVNSLVTYRTIDETKGFIQQVQDQQIYLIVSGKIAKQLLSMQQIIDNSQLNSIYIFCHDQLQYTELVQSSNKVRGIFIDINILCDRLKEDTKQALKNLLPFSITSGTSENEKNQVKFLCSQLHRDLLVTMEYNNSAILELANFCSRIYKSAPTELKNIEELRTTYHAGEAIRWYTRQIFLFKMLNKAFFTQDISILYKFQFFIKDLHTHLEQIHSLYKASLKSRYFTVYRGLSMPLSYFKKTIRDEIYNLIAFDSFLSTSLDENVARQFALDKQDPKNESVLFCIEIDVDKMERPFADISRWSDFKHEREVLFSFGTVFRIDDVADKKTDDGIWVVRLSSVSEKDEQLQKETQQIQITLFKFFDDILYTHREANDLQKLPASNANVASMHYKQGEYDDSLLFYRKALDALNDLGEPDPLTKATYIGNVAKAQKALGRNDEALVLYKQALEIRHLKCQSNDPSLIHTLHTIGEIYCEKKDWNTALDQYNEALKLQLSSLKSSLLSDLSSIAGTYVCIGNIFYQQEKHREALDAFSNALKHQQEHLDKQHPVLAFLYNNIGAMYYSMKTYDLALENQLECLEIESKALPKEHKTFAETYRNIAMSYEKCRQYDEAFEFAQKCIDQLKLPAPKDTSKLNDAIKLLKRIERNRDIRK